MVELATQEWLPPGADPDAPLAVLVHGLTGWRGTWWRVAPALAARGWRVVAVDQRGHGHSPRIEGFATMTDIAADLASALERLGPPADVVIGHSLGAAVTAEVAYQHPDLLRRVVLEDPPTVTHADDPEWLAAVEGEMRAARDDPDGEVARRRADFPAWTDEDLHADIEGRRLADLDGLMASLRRPIGLRMLEIAAALPVPALYLLATEEASAIQGADRRQLEATLPANARVVVMDAGHVIHRDRFDDYLAAITGWLPRSAPTAARRS